MSPTFSVCISIEQAFGRERREKTPLIGATTFCLQQHPMAAHSPDRTKIFKGDTEPIVINYTRKACRLDFMTYESNALMQTVKGNICK